MTLGAPSLTSGQLVDSPVQRRVPASEVVFTGMVWDVRRDTVDLGEAGEVAREYVDHPGAVAVLALRQDRGLDEVLLIQQYRHPVRALQWELPAGLCDVPGEPPELTGRRELAEEAFLRAERWDLLADFVSSPGGMTERLRIYLARGLSDVPEHERHTREAEEHGMPVRWVPLDVAVTAARAGAVRNATTVIGVLLAALSARSGWADLASN